MASAVFIDCFYSKDCSDRDVILLIPGCVSENVLLKFIVRENLFLLIFFCIYEYVFCVSAYVYVFVCTYINLHPCTLTHQ